MLPPLIQAFIGSWPPSPAPPVRARADPGGRLLTGGPASEKRLESQQTENDLTWAKEFGTISNPKSGPTTCLNNKHSSITVVEDAK
jgi:hypothetical protein